MQVDAVEQWAGKLAQVALDDRARAAALPRRVAVETAWTPLQITTYTLHRRAQRVSGRNRRRLYSSARRRSPFASGFLRYTKPVP
jgi:hypothetical protein